MAWCQLGDKPLSEQMKVSLLMHICITRPQLLKHKQFWHIDISELQIQIQTSDVFPYVIYWWIMSPGGHNRNCYSDTLSFYSTPCNPFEGVVLLDETNRNTVFKWVSFTHLPPSAAYMRQWIWSALIQIMACRLFSAIPLSKPMLVIVNCSLRNKLQLKFLIKIHIFYSQKCIWKYLLKMAVILFRGDELTGQGW